MFSCEFCGTENFSELLAGYIEFCFVNQVSTFSFVGLITCFDWKTDHNEMTMWFPKVQQAAS